MANTYTAPRRLYLDKDGKVVERDDPNRLTLLVNAGGELPLARAEELGLLAEEPADDAKPDADADAEPAEAKAVEHPPANKARRAAPETK